MLGYMHLIANEGCFCFKCVRERAATYKKTIETALIVIKDYSFYNPSSEVNDLIKYLQNVIETD